jgi:hypothetical protein
MAIDFKNYDFTNPMGLLNLQPKQQFQVDPMQVQQARTNFQLDPRYVQQAQIKKAQEEANELARRQRAGSMMLALSDVLKGRDPSPGIVARTSPQTSSLTAAQRNYQYAQTLPEPQRTQFLAVTGAIRYDPKAMQELEEAKRKGKAPGGVDISKGQENLDKKFGDISSAWKFGERQQANANIVNLDNKIERLISGEENVSGPGFAFIPEKLKPVLAPTAVGFLDEISDVTYQSLRATLGAQFTENEGKKLVAATFNQNLPEEQNIIRLQRLSAKIKAIRDAKERAIEYFDEYGTLQGYKEEPQSFDDILDSVLFEEFKTLSAEEVMERYKQAPTAEERQSLLRFAKMLKDQEENQK